MNFENVTALELHLHTNEEIESKPEPSRQKHPVVKTETPMSKVKSFGLLVVVVGVSVLLSLVVTFLARKFGSAFGDGDSGN